MADNTEINFSITDTAEMGMGSAELLHDLLAPETSTADVDKLEKIVKETDDPTPEEKKPRGKEIVQKGEGESLTDQDLISNFLGDSTEEEEEEHEEAPIPVAKEEEEESSPFTTLARELYKLNVFTKDEGEEEIEIKTPEEFLEKFNDEKKKGANEMVSNFIAQFGEDYQEAFDAIFVKGVNPKEYFDTYNRITDFASIDLTEKENQIRVIKQALADQGFEPDDITSEIERFENYGDLEAVATKHHKVLVKKEAIKLQQLEQKAAQDLQQKTAIRNQYIQNVQSVLQEKLKTKEFDGIPINPKLVNELQDFLLVDKYKTVSGETLTDFDKTILELKRPENHAMKVKVGLLLKILEKDPTLSTIQRSGITKKSDALFGELAKQVTKIKTPAGSSQKSSWFL